MATSSGPIFLMALNGEGFLDFLRNDLNELLEDVDYQTKRRMWLQMDGAPPHFSRMVREFLNEQFPDKWIGRGRPIPWPSRSPALTSPDFFLWGYIKNVVFKDAPTTKEDMMERIRNACRAIPREVLLKTADEFHKRIVKCIQAEGGNFEHL